MNFQIDSLPLLYKTLTHETRPIFLYGTGDGADKILDTLERFGIPVAGIFVSDEFYRGQTFRGFRVTTLSSLEERFPADGFVVLVAFGSHLPEMIRRVQEIAAKHPLYIPDMPVAGHTLFDAAFCREHEDELSRAGSLFEDELSRRVFSDIVAYKLTGSPDLLFDCVTPKEEVFSSILDLDGEEDYLDVGAYNGDTVREFLRAAGGSFRSITAMEPERHSFRRLSETLSALPGRVTAINAAAASRTGTVTMVQGRGRGSARQADGTHTGHLVETSFQKVDELGLSVTYLKMDVEGMEADALAGMMETLRSCRPKLNIALYHRTEDLYALPLMIADQLPDYRFYLRRHACFPCWEVNLYALPR